MNYNLKVSFFPLSITFLLIAINLGCNNVERINHHESSKIETPIPFISKMNEPWDPLLSTRHQFYDFVSDSCYKMENLENTDLSSIHIISIENKTKLDDFFAVSDQLENLEALQVVSTEVKADVFQKLISNISNKTKEVRLLTSGEKEITVQDAQLDSGEFNDITVPFMFSYGNYFKIKNKLLVVGFKGYYGLNQLVKKVPRSNHYYGFGINLGLKL